MADQNTGTKTAEEILEMEKELEAEAKANEQAPSEFDEDDEDEPEPTKKGKKEKTKVEDDEDEDEGDEDDADEDDSEDEDDDTEDDDETEDDDDEEADDKDEDDDEPKGKKKTPAWQLKMQERRFNKKIAEARTEITKEFEAKYGRKPTDAEKKDLDKSLDDSLAEDFEKEFGEAPDEKTVKFLKFLEKRNSKTNFSPEFTERIAKIEKDAIEKAEVIGFENDFSKQKKLLDKLFPGVSEKALARIKSKVKEFAYTEKYAQYTLDDIIKLHRKALAPLSRKKTGEPSRGGAGQARYTADNLDPEKIDWDSLSVEEAEKTMAALEKGQGKKSNLKIYRKGKRVN